MNAPRSLLGGRTECGAMHQQRGPRERSCRPGTTGSVSEFRISALSWDKDWEWAFAGAGLGLRRDGLHIEICGSSIFRKSLRT